MTQTAAARHDTEWSLPPDLPDEFLAFDESVLTGLDVGAAGKVGLLQLGLVDSDGVTRVQRQYQQAPLHVFRPIYLDPGRPDMAFHLHPAVG